VSSQSAVTSEAFNAFTERTSAISQEFSHTLRLCSEKTTATTEQLSHTLSAFTESTQRENNKRNLQFWLGLITQGAMLGITSYAGSAVSSLITLLASETVISAGTSAMSWASMFWSVWVLFYINFLPDVFFCRLRDFDLRRLLTVPGFLLDNDPWSLWSLCLLTDSVLCTIYCICGCHQESKPFQYSHPLSTAVLKGNSHDLLCISI
jgi:hypothetical protein